MAEDHYDQREALHAVKQVAENCGYDDVETRDAWVIAHGEHHFEQVKRVSLWGCKKSDGRVLWLDRFNRHHTDDDIFNTELTARNALETRLYKRLLDLQKHREQMTKALLNCMEGGKP
jgi:hypothetical protein